MLIGGVLGYVFREKLLSTVDREMKSSIRLYDNRKSIRDAWDTTQSTVSNSARILLLFQVRFIPESSSFTARITSLDVDSSSFTNFSSTVAALTAGETGEATVLTCRRAAAERFNLAR